jgi:hypothetical protein
MQAFEDYQRDRFLMMHAIMPAPMLALMQAFEDYQRGRFLMEECTYKLHTKAGTVVSKRKIEDSYRRGR